jgi:hypothetical protein
MAHVFEGEPDARQADDITPSRFRPKYRALSDAEKALHDAIKAKAAEMEGLFNQVHDLRYPPLPPITITQGEPMEAVLGEAVFDPAHEYLHEGMRSLELAVMWTVKGLTA